MSFHIEDKKSGVIFCDHAFQINNCFEIITTGSAFVNLMICTVSVIEACTHFVPLADESLDTGVSSVSKEPAVVEREKEEEEEEENINQVRTSVLRLCLLDVFVERP